MHQIHSCIKLTSPPDLIHLGCCCFRPLGAPILFRWDTVSVATFRLILLTHVVTLAVIFSTTLSSLHSAQCLAFELFKFLCHCLTGLKQCFRTQKAGESSSCRCSPWFFGSCIPLLSSFSVSSVAVQGRPHLVGHRPNMLVTTHVIQKGVCALMIL